MKNDNVTALSTTQGQTFSLTPKSMEEAMKMAEMMANSDMVPKDFRGKPANVLVAVQMGMEIGLPPVQAIQNIAVINGRPSLWGDAALAVVKGHAKFESIKETYDEKALVATCVIKRRGEEAHTVTFTKADAERAGLWGKPGPWQQYPKRMMQMRARSFALRDVFPDALKGISIAEEAQDIPEERYMGAAEVVKEQPREERPTYSDEDFDNSFDAWAQLIQSGKKTPEALIAFLSSKVTLSDKQKDMIRNVEVNSENA